MLSKRAPAPRRSNREAALLTLALDCAQRFCAAAVYDDASGQITAEASHDIGRGHAERLPAVVAQVLKAAGTDFSRLGLIAVTVGPGSFAGIRVGVAFARGLALALGRPAVGVPTLLAIGSPLAVALGAPVFVVLDARRDHLWCALVEADGRPVSRAAEYAPAVAVELALREGCVVAGSGAGLLVDLSPALAARDMTRMLAFPDAPAISEIGRIGAGLDAGEYPPSPLYLREADARPQTGFALARET